MVALKVPDRLSILTYVSQYYNYFHGRSPIGGAAAVKRPADPPSDGPSGKKNAPVVSKVFPSFKPSKENNPPTSSNVTPPLPCPRQPRTSTQDVSAEKSQQTGTLNNKCMSCNKHVHLVQRQLVDGKLYHRNCAKLLAPQNTSSLFRDAPSSVPPTAGLSISNTVTRTAPPRLGPTGPVQKPSPTSSISSRSSSPRRPASNVTTPATEILTAPVSKGPVSNDSITIPAGVTTKPVAAPRTSTTAAKTIQSKLKFFQAESDDNKPAIKTTDASLKGFKSPDPIKEAQGGQSVPGNIQNVGENQPKLHIDKDKAGGKKHEDSQGSNVGNGNIANVDKIQMNELFDKVKAGTKNHGHSQGSNVGNGNVSNVDKSLSKERFDEGKAGAKKDGDTKGSSVGNGNVANLGKSQWKERFDEAKGGGKKHEDSQGSNVGNGNIANVDKIQMNELFDKVKAGTKNHGHSQGSNVENGNVSNVGKSLSKGRFDEGKAGAKKDGDTKGSSVGNGNVANLGKSQWKEHFDEGKAGGKKHGDSQGSHVGNGNMANVDKIQLKELFDKVKAGAKKDGDSQGSIVGNVGKSRSKERFDKGKAGAKKDAESQGSNVGSENVANIGKGQSKERFDKAKADAKKNKVSEGNKAKAADTSKEDNNNSKPTPKSDPPKKSDATSQVQTVKKETEGGRGRVRLKVNPFILSDLQPPHSDKSPLRTRTPERGPGGLKPAPPNTSEKETPTDWRSMLKPVSKESKSADSSQSSTKVQTNNIGGSQLPEVSLRPVNPPSVQGVRNGQSNPTNTTTSGSKILKTKPDFIPQEMILKELNEIDDNLNRLEKRGVALETKLRHSEDEGEDDSLMDELMVEWFSLIRNKQLAMRRESELVYIGKTQDLEEQQPSVEQELRKLIDKPEHLKTSFERRREEELMSKLMEIVNNRNAIVEVLDEDRLREEEEDQELNKLMENFSVKKDKSKKKSSISKLFTWGSKKEA
ncbi:MICAL-like protein 2 isoform X2 [Phycodurus eques]|nr:MICAL-like protein 2 isoform X2 [Phycodurus eques]